jgi:hypothetical protein
MEVIKIDKIEYYNGTDIIKNARRYSKGNRNSRNLIRSKKILSTDYIYVRLQDDKWIKSDGSSNK